MNNIIEIAYKLINEPLNPNLSTPLEITDIVNYKTAEAGETVEYFASPAQDRGADGLYSIDANGSITYHKINLKTTTPISFSGLQTKLETVLLDSIMNSKDQTALATCKSNLTLQMDNRESRLACDLCLGVNESQKIKKLGNEDLLDVIIRMKQKISDYSTDYILLVAPDVMDAIESYDKVNCDNFSYSFPINEMLARLRIKSVVKVLGNDVYGDVATPILANGKCILVGRNSKIMDGKPLFLVRRKFSGEVARNSGAEEGAVRLINIVPVPYIVNSEGANTLGYGVFGYSSISIVLINYRAISFCENILQSS
jgi:hypothetical protein